MMLCPSRWCSLVFWPSAGGGDGGASADVGDAMASVGDDCLGKNGVASSDHRLIVFYCILFWAVLIVTSSIMHSFGCGLLSY